MAVLSLLVTTAAVNAHAEDAQVYVISDWDTCEDCCTATDLGWFDEMLAPWYAMITDHEDWSGAGFNHNGNIIDGKFVDDDIVGAWGEDEYFLDNATATLVGTHGGMSDDYYEATMRKDQPGDGDCVASATDMKLGNDGMAFLHLSSCHGLDIATWDTWPDATDGLHQIDGFHGASAVNPDFADEYADFADDSFDDSISYVWLDYMYYYQYWNNPEQEDLCPVAFGEGATQSDSYIRLTSEQYDVVFVTGPSGDYRTVMYIGGCDPLSGEEM